MDRESRSQLSVPERDLPETRPGREFRCGIREWIPFLERIQTLSGGGEDLRLPAEEHSSRGTVDD